MQVKNISKRLRKVASFVPQGAKILDVGSDHAYLPIYLMQQERIVSAIAGEVVEGPYQSAVANVADNGLADKISVRLANGLAAFDAEDQIDVIVIAGMGGRLIADILANGSAKLASVKRLILQPNNREDELRRWLCGHNFQIIEEAILEENGKFYEIMIAEQGKQILSAKQGRFGPYLMREQSIVFQNRWQREADKLEKALAKIPEKNLVKRSAMSQKIKQIKEVLHAGE
ncbi:tRNA (adenine(22)-N(1))-methyltransferase [Streptococcus constellatus]|uniref:tRNA (Adenine(22)-N(1))-methyltransferase n=1 Tax=Streptococcus constellatus TaxID=76860 RepID=A0A564TUU9_STRCV|nr:tRNA (adenine(22)-N(1))-methyltransferase TrmK [Streptococcus constellatus]VUX11016.1 tRNA (adenine(22)-N(1))-methyltransferase [Streptococcus constellatus]VUX12871.1 tRNA (adenine(22)-N(1))-methyltransferase [Streptococcus gordonii]